MDEQELFDKMRAELLRNRVVDRFIDANASLCELIDFYRDIHGFMASHIYRAVEILYDMVLDNSVTKILSFTGNIVATGLRGLITQMINEGFFNIIITTCGAVDHDIAKATGHNYYKGDWSLDDSWLRELDIHRLGNILIPVENYGLAIEKFAYSLLDELVKVKREWRPSEILYEAGLRLNDSYSFIKACSSRNIPIYVPGIFDGSFGTQIVLHSQFSGLRIDIIGDEKQLMDQVFSSEKLGGLIIGGGISKHHTIWWAQFKEGLDYAIYVTTAVEYDGSLSGAHPREAISWGKIKPSSKHVVVYGDATILLPLIYVGVKCLMRSR